MIVFCVFQPPAVSALPQVATTVSLKKPAAPLEFKLSAASKYRMFKGFASRNFQSAPNLSRLWRLDASLVPAELKTEDDAWKKGWLTPDQVRECGGVMIDENFDHSVDSIESVNIGDGDLIVVEPRDSESHPWPMDPAGHPSAVVAVKPLFQSGGYVESLEKSAKIVPSSTSTASSSKSGGFLGMFTRSKGDGSSGQTEKSRMGRVGLSNL